ncbi:hypothetical protein PHLCEN_2v11781 [Hermanssonia centrifuga]|uniref:Uncharacterized protein n=1 Tax=Hermanssonia centrifuga TaxID=98765 RepID=A0A2R6NJ16_9APHY|nr:hypothetical protein PHLCEN_2v11781 [Hermanssonia centrifuga]
MAAMIEYAGTKKAPSNEWKSQTHPGGKSHTCDMTTGDKRIYGGCISPKYLPRKRLKEQHPCEEEEEEEEEEE